MLEFDIYSPEEQINLACYAEKSVQVFIKRDDLIHPFISGNKWRKLKYTLQEAKLNGISQLVTFGGAWSNHLLATANAGAKFGFQTYAFVRGEPVTNPVLALCKLFGMHLHFVDREAYRDKESLYAQHFAAQPQSLKIDEGGYGPLGMLGCADIIEELHRDYDHIFCACGTGTTLAGLEWGRQRNKLSFKTHGVPVLKGGSFIADEVQALAVDPSAITLHLDYHFGGYAKTKPELLAFVQQFCRQTGIMIEPTYTGKMIYAVHDLIAQDYFPKNSKILILHTGGLTGFLGMYDKFA